MEDKYKHKIVTIPNVLSFFRLLLIPVILWLWPGIGGVTVTAIRQAFEAAGDTCVSADALQFTSNKLSKFVSWGHTTMYRRIPKLFRFGYGYAENHPKMMGEDAAVVKLLTGGAEQLHSFLVASGWSQTVRFPLSAERTAGFTGSWKRTIKAILTSTFTAL